MLAPLSLIGRVLALGLERPAFKALARQQDSIAASTVTYSIALCLLLPIAAGTVVLNPSSLEGLEAWWPYALASGVVGFLGYNLNMYALGKGEVGILAPLYSTNLVLLFFLETAFGSAQFSWLALFAILLVASGVVLLDADLSSRWHELARPYKVLQTPGAVPMLLSALLLAVVRLIDKQGSALAPQIPYAFVATLPVVVLSVGVLTFQGRIKSPVQLLCMRPLPALAASGSHIAGYLLLLATYRYYDASTVESVGQLSLFISLLIAATWFAEPARQRWMPTALVVAGTAILLLVSKLESA